MSIDSVSQFFAMASCDSSSAWDYDAILRMSGIEFPRVLLGDQEGLLRGDQHRVWIRWFLEGLVSPFGISKNGEFGRLDIFAIVLGKVNKIYQGIDLNRRRNLAERISEILYLEVERYRQPVARDYASVATKVALLSAATTPRCYICGFEFSTEAVDAFLKTPGRNPVQTPSLVDIFSPRGLKERDIKIEVEHVMPVAAGGHGQDNLRLACGWCNKYKSDRVSIYEATFVPPKTQKFNLGVYDLYELPNPFWTVRTLALRKRCQFLDGCDRTAENSQLVVALNDWRGSPNPTNISVYCLEHDPVAGYRMQHPDLVKKLWDERRV